MIISRLSKKRMQSSKPQASVSMARVIDGGRGTDAKITGRGGIHADRGIWFDEGKMWIYKGYCTRKDICSSFLISRINWVSFGITTVKAVLKSELRAHKRWKWCLFIDEGLSFCLIVHGEQKCSYAKGFFPPQKFKLLCPAWYFDGMFNLLVALIQSNKCNLSSHIFPGTMLASGHRQQMTYNYRGLLLVCTLQPKSLLHFLPPQPSQTSHSYGYLRFFRIRWNHLKAFFWTDHSQDHSQGTVSQAIFR